jgi:hypothetical protein
MLLVMKMVKQAVGSNECGLCAVAMLTDRTKEEILADVANPENPDHVWLNYMEALGYLLEDVRNDPGFDRTFAWRNMFNGYLALPQGNRYYCTVLTAINRAHAVAIDEFGMVFDPSTGAPMQGSWTLAEYLRCNQQTLGNISIAYCYRVRRAANFGS